ncbi:hypothetical protein CU669_17970 [Paramagnetospirillum kuznetsovii]|uniref:Uncharacterized protein n=1 Tax=Paramagnetospirillum kuznetsovii TaxID=2053833 RepID=A0A364NU48_9PROT|nr:hypothetical protein [Paramagnetospirillum kuznetsovii]RAU20530.1 hypothetical protein CU669_17970 [Paramagnetospirillum kuznetsovii]
MEKEAAAVWRALDGSPVSCVEKLKVLEQNLAEFRALALDLLEDAVLMGCDPDLVRQVLRDVVDRVELRFMPRQME